MSYTDSRRLYTERPAIIQSRGSSADSRTSSNQSSTDEHQSSSRSTMANQGSDEAVKQRRVPDNDRHYITTIARENKPLIHNHDKKLYDRDAPLASRATDDDYRRQDTERREQRRAQHS